MSATVSVKEIHHSESMFSRKRTRSSSCGSESEEQSKKKQTVLNGDDAMSETPVSERVAILDAGAQYGKVIDRKVRELFVESVILPLNTTATHINTAGFRAIIISGGPNSVNDSDAPSYDPAIFQLDVPILGICYGLQLINKHYGGTVVRKQIREDGQFTVTMETSCALFAGLSSSQEVLLSHGDSIEQVPDCLEVTATSGELVAALTHREKKVFGVQFHPEVELTENGTAMLKNFLYQISGCHGNYTILNREQSCINYIRQKVGDATVLSLVSGGVDSAVCTALLNVALGPSKVIAVHIDNGFMRKNESEDVKTSLEALGLKPFVVAASLKFYTGQTLVPYCNTDGSIQQRYTLPLHSVTNPEHKRKIIGDTFVKVVENVIADLQLHADDVYLAQGTLRPDLIESASILASTKAQVIKTHHNDTELVRELRKKGRVIEPLCDFHKDEVRVLGETLGLPKDIVYRHPFPGPGLAIRVICQSEAYISEDYTTTNTLLALFQHARDEPETLLSAVQHFTSQDEQHFIIRTCQQNDIYATLLPIYSVGVQGDARTYNYVAVLSCPDTSEPDWSDLMRLAKLIPRVCHNVNRVIWAFGGVVKGPIEDVTPTYLTNGVLATLREADSLATDVLASHKAQQCISQMPVVLIPIHFDRNQRPTLPSCQRSLVLRTFITSDFMTGVPATPGKQLPINVLEDIVKTLQSVSGISRVLYDLTPKPPGTTEWE